MCQFRFETHERRLASRFICAGEFSAAVVVETRRRNEVPDGIPEIECCGIIGGGTASGIRFRNARDGNADSPRGTTLIYGGIAPAIRRKLNFFLLKVTLITRIKVGGRKQYCRRRSEIHSFTASFTRDGTISKDWDRIYCIYLDATFRVTSSYNTRFPFASHNNICNPSGIFYGYNESRSNDVKI